jgi:hypothetical protein
MTLTKLTLEDLITEYAQSEAEENALLRLAVNPTKREALLIRQILERRRRL